MENCYDFCFPLGKGKFQNISLIYKYNQKNFIFSAHKNVFYFINKKCFMICKIYLLICSINFFFFLKFNQIWCVSHLHEWHMHRHHFFGPRPLEPWGEAKRSNIIKPELQSQFHRFLNQTLCNFSQMKDI